MPDARTHDLITFATGAALAPATYAASLALGSDQQAATFYTLLLTGGHIISGTMFSPDLDLDSSIDDRWGIFFWIWRPYMWAVPHRSRWLSHGLVVPALLRLLYFYVMVVALLIALVWALGRLGVVLPSYHVRLTLFLRALIASHPREVAAFTIGFITGGAAHTIADWLVTGGKRYLRRLGVRVSTSYAEHDRWQPRARRRARW